MRKSWQAKPAYRRAYSIEDMFLAVCRVVAKKREHENALFRIEIIDRVRVRESRSSSRRQTTLHDRPRIRRKPKPKPHGSRKNAPRPAGRTGVSRAARPPRSANSSHPAMPSKPVVEQRFTSLAPRIPSPSRPGTPSGNATTSPAVPPAITTSTRASAPPSAPIAVTPPARGSPTTS